VSPAAYLLGVNVTVAPIALYFFGRNVLVSARFCVIRNLVIIHWLVVIFSLVVHFIRPDFYTNAVSAALSSGSSLEIWQIYARLQGALGSTVMGGLCAVSILMLVVRGFDRRVKWVFAFTFFFGAVMSFQRAPMLLASVALVAVWLFDRSSAVNKLVVAVALFSTAVVVAGLDVDEALRIIDRGAEALRVLNLEDRPSYDLIGPHFSRFPFGQGLGATTSAADAAGYNPGGQMVDANHIRLLADLGPLGLMAFIAAALLGVFRSIRQRSTLWIAAVILALNLQALVTNVFDSYYISHLYWLILGLLACAVPRAGSRTAHADGVYLRRWRAGRSIPQELAR